MWCYSQGGDNGVAPAAAGETCSASVQCERGLTCCAWDNAAGANAKEGTCGEMCTQGTVVTGGGGDGTVVTGGGGDGTVGTGDGRDGTVGTGDGGDGTVGGCGYDSVIKTCKERRGAFAWTCSKVSLQSKLCKNCEDTLAALKEDIGNLRAQLNSN